MAPCVHDERRAREDPIRAIAGALDEETYDGIIISTLPQGRSPWLTAGLPQRAAEEFGLPVVTFESADAD